VADLEESVRLTRGRDAPELLRALGNLASVLGGIGELDRGRAITEEALELARELGVGEPVRWLTGEVAFYDFLDGRWEEAAATTGELAEEYVLTPFWMEPVVFSWNARLLAARGAGEEAVPWLERAVRGGRNARDLQMLVPSLSIAARVYEELGDEGSLAIAREVLGATTGIPGGSLADDWLKDLWFVLDRHGVGDELMPLLDVLPRTPWVEAVVALARGDFAAAAEVYAGLGLATPEADVRMWAADRLAGQGRAADADAEARRALAFWQSVGATAHIRRTESLLAAAS
jgi:hypothetical protein